MQEELKELKKLNKKEFLTLAKEYYLTSFLSLFKNKNPQGRKLLLEKLKEYFEIIQMENTYYNHFIKNISKIRNTDGYEDLIDSLDILNEKTYMYFDRILKEYETFLMSDEETFTLPYKDFDTILERTDLKEDAKSLTFSYYDLMQYFSSEDAMYYLVPRTKIIENHPEFHGLFVKEQNNLLKEIKLCIPPIKDRQSLEECVYFYKAGILMHEYLGRQIPGNIDFSKLASYEVDSFKKKVLQKM